MADNEEISNQRTVKPNPDPTTATVEQMDKAEKRIIEIMTVRIDAVAEAQKLYREDQVRVPTLVDRATEGMKSLVYSRVDLVEQVAAKELSLLTQHLLRMEQRLDKAPDEVEKALETVRTLTGAELRRIEEVFDQRFLRIDSGLSERDKRADQLALANSAALAAALAAQKEAAGESQKSAALAISKSEAATAESIKGGQALFQTAITAITGQVNEIKSRLDRGEGARNITDPATTQALTDIMSRLAILSTTRSESTGEKRGADSNTAWMISVIMAIIGVGGVLAAVFVHTH